MKELWMDEGKVRIVILAFSILGLVLLGIVSFSSGIEKVHISELKSHSGETVEVEGTVVGAFHHGSGLTESLIHEEGTLLFLDIERSTREIHPGDVVRVRGEAFAYDEKLRMSVSTDRTMSVRRADPLSGFTTSDINSICRVQGIVVAVEDHGRYGYNISFEGITPTGDRFQAWAMVIKDDDPPVPGEGIEVVGLLTTGGGMVCFGPDSLRTIYNATPLDTLLTELSASEPGSVPRDPLTFDCYLRYTPMGRSMYLGESPEGGMISVKATMSEPITGLSRGDRIRLINCSLEWDAASMRYVVLPSKVLLIKPHDIWMLSLGSLPYGIGDFEGCRVNLTGEIIDSTEGLLIVDGNASLEVRGGDPGDPAIGLIAFDQMKNRFFLDREREF